MPLCNVVWESQHTPRVQNAKTWKESYLYFRHLGPQDTGEFVQYDRRKKCAPCYLQTVECTLSTTKLLICPFLILMHLLTLSLLRKKNVCRFKAVDWAPQCKRQYTTFAVTWTASLSWSVLHFFESLTEQPMVRLSLSSWHCSSAGCGCRTWPPDTEGSWKYIELGARTADKERSSTLG